MSCKRIDIPFHSLRAARNGNYVDRDTLPLAFRGHRSSLHCITDAPSTCFHPRLRSLIPVLYTSTLIACHRIPHMAASDAHILDLHKVVLPPIPAYALG
jgi:hypothetical protein